MSLAGTETARVRTGSAFRLLAYGLPALALAFPLVPFAVYLPTYYAERQALGFGSVALALFLSRLVDMLSDPLVGVLSDRTRHPFLKRKGWIAVGGIIAAIALDRLCAPGGPVSALYLGGWSAVLYIGWTMVMIPYQAWGADIARDTRESTRFATAREAFGLVGMVSALSLPLVWHGDLLPALPGLLIPIGALSVLAALIVLPDSANQPPASDAAMQSLIAVARTPVMRAYGTVWFLTATASAIPAALFPLYVADVLEGSERQKDIAILLYFAAAIIAMPLWARLSDWRDKKQLMALGMLTVCIVFPLATLLGAGQMAFFYLICGITGMALAAELVLGPALLADIARNRARLGQADTASHFALWGMISKLAFAFAILLAFGTLALVKQATGGSVPAFVVALVYALLPTLLKAAATRKLWLIPGRLS